MVTPPLTPSRTEYVAPVTPRSTVSLTCQKTSATTLAVSSIALIGAGTGLVVTGVGAPLGAILIASGAAMMFAAPFALNIGKNMMDIPGGDRPAIHPRLNQVPYNMQIVNHYEPNQEPVDFGG